MQNFERFLCATRLVRLSPTNRSKPKNAKIMLFQAGSDTPPLLKQSDISANAIIPKTSPDIWRFESFSLKNKYPQSVEAKIVAPLKTG